MNNDAAKVRSIFVSAVEEYAPDEWEKFLDDACRGDLALRRRVELLLQAHEGEDSLLDRGNETGTATTIDQPIAEGPGTVIGPYKLSQQIGEGGFGVVFLAEQERPVRRRVALKIIRPGMDTREVIARFEAERQALAVMNHPNIAKVFDADTTKSGRPYFAMELVQGVPITEYCDECNLTTRERLELFITVCHAVQHAHQKGIIHRDIKPTNVLVAIEDGRPAPKIIDFGVAKALNQQLSEHMPVTAFAQMVGTPLYMSPEQAELSPLGADTRSDIYSLGALGYELLTGTTPFDKNRLHSVGYDEMRRIIREEEPPRPSTRLTTLMSVAGSTVADRHRTNPHRLVQAIRGELDWIVMKCLDKDRNRRYATVGALIEDVQHYLNDEPVEACPPSVAYRFHKFVRRNRGVLTAAGLVAAVLIFGTALSVSQAVRATRAERLAQTRYEAERLARQETDVARRAAENDRLQAKQNAAAAIAEAAKSKATVNLLQQMLSPEVNRAQNYTVRQMLDDFSDRLSGRLADQPELEAEIRTIIAGVYQKLSLFEKAEPHLQAALDFRRQHLGQSHPQVAESLLASAWNANNRGQFAQAEAQAREALTLARQNGNSRAILAALHPLQNFLNQQDKYSEAELIGADALAIVHSLDLQRDWIACEVRLALASTRIGQKRWVEAEDLIRQGLAIAEGLKGERDHRTAVVQASLVSVLEARGAYAEAEEICRQALSTLHGIFGSRHVSVARLTHRLAAIMSARSNFQAAELTFLEALSIARELAGAEPGNRAHNRLLISIRWDIAEMYLLQGEREKALAEWTKTIEREPASADAWFWRAEFRRRSLHQWEEALADYSQVIELDPKRADARDKLAWILLTCPNQTLRDPPRALTLAQEAVELEPDQGPYWNTLGVAHYRAGQWQKAIEALEESVRLYEGRDLSFNAFFLAIAHWQRGERDVARRWYDEAVAWMREHRPDDERLVAFRMEAEHLMGLSTKQDPPTPEP